LNSSALLLFIYIAFRRADPATRPEQLVLVLQAVGVVGVLVSGWLGATLVYRNQIGVDHRYAHAGQWKERTLRAWDQPACNQSELNEGQMMMVHVGNESFVIGRCAQGYAAFSNQCTHKGGPLADGALVGCTVQCPWHGSQFDIHTGRVVSGPAGHKIRTYEVEVRGGEVYVLPQEERKAA
jgi:nitrite reductase/ring-hydroxylating ferredoxin subunit